MSREEGGSVAMRLASTVAMLLVMGAGATVSTTTGVRAQGLAAVPNTMAPIYMNNTIGLVGIDAARRSNQLAAAKRSDRSTTAPPMPSGTASLPAPPASLRFDVGMDRAVSDEVREQFFTLVRANYGAPEASSIMATYALKPVRQAFLEVATPAGLGDRDLRDVATAYLVVGWMTANQTPPPDNARIRAVRAQVAEAMLANPPSASAAARQAAAEQMMYEITALIYARQEGQQSRDAAGLSRMADRTADSFLKRGLDLRRVIIADGGFAAR